MEEEEEEEEGYGDIETGTAGHGAGEPGQTGERGVGHVQTGGGVDFLQYPSPPDVKDDGDPH